jgi:hypothetical protein
MAPFHDHLDGIGLSNAMVRKFTARRDHSLARLDELERRLKSLAPLNAYANLTVYAAGSYARGEASTHSDIDLFFIHSDSNGPKIDDPRLKNICVMSAVIREMEEGMEFSPPSNDGQFLNIIKLSQIQEHLGGMEDDYRNHFTARMLLLLESFPVYGKASYDQAISEIIDAYLRDYEDHADVLVAL